MASSNDFNEDEMNENQKAPSEFVYTEYKGFSQLSNFQNNSDSKKAPKAQVFTTYVQNKNTGDYEKNQSSQKYNYQQKTITDRKPESHDSIKKFKLSAANSIPKDNNSNMANKVETNLINDLNLASFVGLQSFANSETNIFTNFIDNNLILVSLDSRSQFKSKFCFKGKCKFSLVYGQISINGFNFKSQKLFENSNSNSNVFKCYDLYSAETNSFICINNIQNEKISTVFDENQIEKLINILQLNYNLNISSSTHLKLKEFLKQNQFSTESSSLFVLEYLDSQLSNYLSYFENFHHIYMSNTSTIERQDLDIKLAKLGLYPIEVQNFNAIKFDTNEEKLIVSEILGKNEEVNEQSPIVMACGGKDVGKSTFLRYLVNNLLNNHSKVAYIDCDPGQCEFTLGGCISLNVITDPIFGPPHTHIEHSNSHNKFCYFLGHLSPSDVPSHYMRCLRQCYEDFKSLKSSNEKIPLIVNTMGWNQGLGLCLLKESILLFEPTHIIQINHPVEANKNMPVLDKNWLQTSDGWPSTNRSSKIEDNNFTETFNNSSNQMETEESNHSNYKLLTLMSNAPHKSSKFQNKSPQKRFSPKDHRTIAIVSYFSRLQDSNLCFKPIHHLRPYRILWSKLALHISHAKVDFDQFFRVFNASLVGLCKVDPKFICKKENYPNFLPGYLNHMDRENNTPVLYKCMGFGIIRGINMETKEFYILTPDSIENLNQVNLLVKGMLNTPLEFFFEQDSETPCPYLSFSDNLPNQKESDLNAVCNKPVQRKYLIHQTHAQQQHRVNKN